MSEEYFRPEITFEDLEVGDVFISLDNRIDENGLYMKVHIFDFTGRPSKTSDYCLNFCTGNVFKIYPDTKVRKIQKLFYE